MRLFLILGFFLMAGISKADFVVQSEPTMVAYPTPQIGQQWSIKSDGTFWKYNGAGFQLVAISYDVNSNVKLGSGAGASITTGSNNVLVGTSAGQSLTTGVNNVYTGYNSASQAATASTNVAVGFGALAGNSVLSNGNVAVGASSGLNSSGPVSQCLYLGTGTGQGNSTSGMLYIGCFGVTITYGNMLSGWLVNNAAVTDTGNHSAASYSVGATPTPGGSVTLTTSQGNAVWNSGIYTGISGATPTPSILSGTVTFPTNAQTPVGVSNTNITTSSRAGINEINTGSGLISETFSHNPYSGSVSFWGSSATGPVTASYWIFP